MTMRVLRSHGEDVGRQGPDAARPDGASGRRPATVVACVITLGLGLVSPSAASARNSYCSPSGDICYGATAGPPVRLRISLAADYFGRYRLCVTGPHGPRECHGFRIHRQAHGIYGSTVRWSVHFTNRGHGTYRARWGWLGELARPGVTFRR